MKRTLRLIAFALAVLFTVAGIVLSCIGFAMKAPDKYIYVSSSYNAYDYGWERNIGAEYVGGDAYNLMMEASMKAGYYAGTVISKAIYVVGGLLLGGISVFVLMYFLKDSFDMFQFLKLEKLFRKVSAKSLPEVPSEEPAEEAVEEAAEEAVEETVEEPSEDASEELGQ